MAGSNDTSAPGAGLSWRREAEPVWDEDKIRIVGGAPEGIFALPFTLGSQLPGDWFAAAEGADVVGYGWLDVAWGDAEILLAVDSARQRGGVGSFVLSHIEAEAADRGVNYVYNRVSPRHPQHDEVQGWLESHGFVVDDSGPTLRKRVRRSTPATGETGAPGRSHNADGLDPSSVGSVDDTVEKSAAPRVQKPRLNVPTFDSGRDMPPGREDSGGYVDPESHQY